MNEKLTRIAKKAECVSIRKVNWLIMCRGITLYPKDYTKSIQKIYTQNVKLPVVKVGGAYN